MSYLLRRSIFGQARAWTPANTATAVWLDAADPATITQSLGAVSQWNDKSGNARHATQPAANNQPTYVSSGLGGKPMLRFFSAWNAQQTLSSYKFAAPSTDFAFFTVFSTDSINSNDGTVIGNDGAGYQGNGMYVQNNNLGIRTTFNRAGIATPVTANSYVAAGTLGLAGLVHTASNTATMYNNGNAGSSVSALNWTAGNRTDYAIGLYVGGTAQSISLLGYIAEHIAIVGTITTETRQRIEGYLAHKWGLTASLPANHPYKTERPTTSDYFTPSNIATALWLDASDVSTITSSVGAVSQWNDKSGNARHATQATGTSQAITNSRSLNGLNVLDFDGTDDLMDLPVLGLTDGCSAYIVFETDDTSYSLLGGVENDGWERYNPDGRTYSQILRVGRLNFNFGIDIGAPSSGAHIWGYNVLSTTPVYNIHIDGGSYSNTVAFTFQDNIDQIGKGATYFNGKMAEIIIVNSFLSDSTRQKIEGYLAHKWGLTASLPADHPYRLTKPRRSLSFKGFSIAENSQYLPLLTQEF